MENSVNSLNLMMSNPLEKRKTAEKRTEKINKENASKYKKSKRISISKIKNQMQETFFKVVSGDDGYDNEDYLGFGSMIILISIILTFVYSLHKI